jgi:hypothetical protein
MMRRTTGDRVQRALVRRHDARLRIVTIDAGRPPVQVPIRVDDNNHVVDLIVSSSAHNPIHKTRGSSRIVFVRTIHEVDPVFQTPCRAVSKRLRRVVADGETIRAGSEPWWPTVYWRPLREPSTPGCPFPLTGACAKRGAIPRASSSSTKRATVSFCHDLLRGVRRSAGEYQLVQFGIEKVHNRAL